MLISCIMPTLARPQYAAHAVELWLAQTYSPTELVIVDDIDSPSFPNGCNLPGVQYHLMRQRLPVGSKRNIACSRSAGDVIAHWDDDDYSAPGRLADQMTRLLDSGKPVTGYRCMRFTDGTGWWEYSASVGYVTGTSLMYRRSWWQQHPFTAEQTGEDVTFVKEAQPNDMIATADAGELMYATIHPRNTSVRPIHLNRQWRKIA
jgi:glycosyltransferase involved in cell wall biosynthesis